MTKTKPVETLTRDLTDRQLNSRRARSIRTTYECDREINKRTNGVEKK